MFKIPEKNIEIIFFCVKLIKNNNLAGTKIMEEIEIYTDGGCDPNPGRGGWAYVILYPDGKVFNCWGVAEQTTNNRMEMQAVIEGIKCGLGYSRKCQIKVYSDSQYLVKGFNEWMQRWQYRGWTRCKTHYSDSSKKEVKNLDLWQCLWDLKQKGNIVLKWVKGHNGNKYNELCDSLCNQAIGQNRKNTFSYNYQPIPEYSI